MSASILIVDESLNGERTPVFTLESLSETMTVREIIRGRIYQEVQDFNQQAKDVFQGLVKPGEAEEAANGYRFRKHQQIDWETQFEKACEAFESNGFFMIIDNQQAESLDEKFTIAVETEVSFIRLVQLVGG